MLRLSEIIRSRHVALDLTDAHDHEARVRTLIELLRDDARVVNWASFEAKLMTNARKGLTALNENAAMCHGRTEAVSEIVMAAGRIVQPAGDCYLFVIGLPPAMAAEYLRTVGALARIFGNQKNVAELGEASTREQFVETLNRTELRPA